MTDATAIRAVGEPPATQARHGPSRAGAVVPGAPAPKPKLLDRVRDAIRTRHYSYRTEEAYLGWIKRFILFHGKRHPAEMGKPEIEQIPDRIGGEAELWSGPATRRMPEPARQGHRLRTQ